MNVTKRNMPIISCRGLYYTFGTPGKTYKEAHNFRISLDEKTKCNLKLLKSTMLQVNILLLFYFAFFSFRHGIISKRFTLVLNYVLTTNDIQLSATL